MAKAASYEVSGGTNSDFNAYEMPKPWTHRHMYTATYRSVCYGWRVGIVKSIAIVTATAAPDCDLTLPYLTLNYYKQLPCYIILP